MAVHGVQMKVKYYLVDNPLTPDPNDCRAVVQADGSVGVDELVQRIVEQNSTLSKPVLAAVFSQLPDVIAAFLSENRNVNLPFGNFRLSIQGTFSNSSDSFDESRHGVSISVAPPSSLSVKLGAQGFEKIVQASPAPILIEFEDTGSGTFNSTVTPGNIGRIRGLKLKVDTAKAEDGVFFVPAGGGAAVKVPALANNKAGEVMFLIPALAAGTYRLEVRVAYTAANISRIGSLDSTLTVL